MFNTVKYWPSCCPMEVYLAGDSLKYCAEGQMRTGNCVSSWAEGGPRT